MSIEKNRLTEVIPQGIVDEAEPFVLFLKKYYEFMHITNNPSQTINEGQALRDVKRATEYFLNKLYNEVGSGFYINKENIDQDTANVLENLRYVYETKGSSESIKALFRIIYGEEVEIYFPSELILIASDGRWTQDYSVFVDATLGDPNDIDQQIVLVNTAAGETFDLEIKRVKDIITSNKFEIYIDKYLTHLIDVGTTFTSQDGQTVVTVLSATYDTPLYASGTGFSVGDIFIIEDGAVGLRVKVTSVGASGEVLTTGIVSTNYGYTAGKSYMLQNDGTVTVTNDPAADLVTYPDRAIITIANGPIVKYPGYYSSNKGFLSDRIFLQDNYFYQQYSYVIQSALLTKEFETVLYKTTHPAGTKMFGEYHVNNTFDMRAVVSAVANYFRYIENDEVYPEDVVGWLFTKPIIGDNVTATDDDFIIAQLKEYSSSATATHGGLYIVKNSYYEYGYADDYYAEEEIIIA